MTKIKQTILILVIATVAFMPVKTFAGSILPGAGCAQLYISDPTDPYYGARCDAQQQELRLRSIEAKIQSLENSRATGGATCYCDQNINAEIKDLYSKVGILERTVNFLVNQISNTLQEIIKFLTK